MSTTYLLGFFVPTASEMFVLKDPIPLKVTIAQREAVSSSYEYRESFREEAIRRLREKNPALASKYGSKKYEFGILKTGNAKYEEFFKFLAQFSESQIEDMELDLTDMTLQCH